MNYRSTVALLAFAAGLAAAPAGAQTLTFTGARENVNPALPPGGRCVPPYFNTVTIIPGQLSSTGVSNIGAFTSTQSHCITSPPPTTLVDGLFTYQFEAGDTIFGTYTGDVVPSSTSGALSATENLVVTGGTGRFVGASGSITSSGLLRLIGGNSVFEGDLTGSITAPTTTQTGNFALATGIPSAATGDFATAYGAFSYAAAERAVAVGPFAEATASGATAIGNDTAAAAPNATAVGNGAAARFAGSTAVGAGAATTRANQVVIGAAGSSVTVGDIGASTAAQAGPVDVVTVDAQGTLGRGIPAASLATATQVAALQASQASQAVQIADLQAGQASLFAQSAFNLREVRRANEGVAMALSMETPMLPSGANFAIAGGVGYFRDRVASTASFIARVGPMSAISGGIGIGFNSGDVGARAGFQHAW